VAQSQPRAQSPEDRLDEVKRLAKATVEKIKMGDPSDKDVTLGP
jgi:aldehyde dehydrogenase (NAD+)